MPLDKSISIIGAGLVGSLAAIYLSKLGFKVQVFEKRSDPRKSSYKGGRSINLALSHRGIQALKGAGVYEGVQEMLLPMFGRKIHSLDGEISFQPYGKEGQHINSVSRNNLNVYLINEAENAGAEFQFDRALSNIDFDLTKCYFEDGSNSVSDAILGTDGAFSTVRREMQKYDRFNYEQHYISYGYKELKLSPIHNDFAMDSDGLHIWPRGPFMLIALPNTDKTFTCTLFLSYEGKVSFENLNSDQEILNFFDTYFNDLPLDKSELLKQFSESSTSSLVTIRCFPWLKNNTLIVGDAAHAVVPFYGQGMNAGFEGVRILGEMLANSMDLDSTFKDFQHIRKPDADAISHLALKNFEEMSDWVNDKHFLRRKKIERELHELYPEEWIPQYSMVTFSDIRYSEALEKGDLQESIISEILQKSSTEIIYQEAIDRLLGNN